MSGRRALVLREDRLSERALEALLFHLRPIAAGSSDDWATGFSKSILKQARNPRWRPSQKQRETMERLVAEAFQVGDGVVIE